MDFAPHVARQRAYFLSGATRSTAFRQAQLGRLLAALGAREGALLAALHADLGKSPLEAYTTELGMVRGEISHAVRHLPRWVRPQRRPVPPLTWPARGWVAPEPFGVTLIIGPWNYPLQLLLAPLVAALAAGNCALLKPSEFAPRTAAVVADLIGATFPPEYVAVVNGERDTAEALLREQFDRIFFTGSTRVGRAVAAAAARQLTPVTLELGGKCPCLVAADAPLAVAARRIVWGKFLNAGQTCVAPDYVLVDRRVAADLLAEMIRAVREFYGPDPRRSPDYSRIIHRAHWDRLAGYLASGRVVCGGAGVPEELYFPPTILADVPPDAPVLHEEIFGPLLPVREFSAWDEALAFVRDRPAPLALYLFTPDRALQRRVLAETRSGGVALNDTVTHMIGAGLPFGGVGESGQGRYHGQAGFAEFTYPRSVLRRSPRWDAGLLFPPPRASFAMVKRSFRWLLGG